MKFSLYLYLLISLNSCSLLTMFETNNLDFSIELPDNVISKNDILIYVANNIKWESDSTLHNGKDFWQTPKETMKSKTGDCTDFSTLEISMLEVIGIDAKIIFTHFNGENKMTHAIISINSVQIEPQSGKIVNMPIDDSMSWEDFKFTMNNKNSGHR